MLEKGYEQSGMVTQRKQQLLLKDGKDQVRSSKRRLLLNWY